MRKIRLILRQWGCLCQYRLCSFPVFIWLNASQKDTKLPIWVYKQVGIQRQFYIFLRRVRLYFSSNSVRLTLMPLVVDHSFVRSLRTDEPWWKHSFELLKGVHLNLDWQLISFHNLRQLKFGSFDFVLLDHLLSRRASTVATMMGNGSTCCARIFSIDFEIDHPKMHKISDSLLDAAKCILVNV